jgi:hypothetical protein
VPAPPQLLEASDRFNGLDATVLDFWRWAFSDLRDNTGRGILAEFFVATALARTEMRRMGQLRRADSSGTRVEVRMRPRPRPLQRRWVTIG